MSLPAWAFGVALALAAPAFAQAQESPYAGQHTREIKALPAEERAALLAGEGLGYAKAAELNGYPGPAHVLELAQQLELSPGQLEQSRRLFAVHKAEARRLGAALVEAERALDQAFAGGHAQEEAVRRLTMRIGSLQAELRFEHLKTHLAQTALLQPEQVQRYMGLRGYHGSGHAHGTHRHRGPGPRP